jgi:Uma2 family endonuclease
MNSEDFPLSNLPPERSPQEDLDCHYASQCIEQTYYLHPEFRLELVEGKFLIGGTLAGSRWLLREALLGWDAGSAIAFAPLAKWWEALRIAHKVSHQSPEDWLIWAESQAIADTREGWGRPLGSQYGGEHRWVRDRLYRSLSSAVSQSGLGYCFGPHYGMWIGDHIFTPDMQMLEDVQLAENQFYDCYMRGAANLVVEITMPEHTELDQQVRRQYYEQHGVAHYWIINPVAQQTQFWVNTPNGYQARSIDADGSYRGFPGLTFTPSLLWIDQDYSPIGLPIITSDYHSRQWRLGYKESPSGESWDSLPFQPLVELEPTPIQPEQFIAWCPESKLESRPFPLIGGEQGTRNAIAMLLMTLGLVETVKLLPKYEWVRVLRRIEREQQGDIQKRQEWWNEAGKIAQKLHTEHQVGGVGVIGDLLQSKPLNYWSRIHLVVWDCPEQFSRWKIHTENTLPSLISEVADATPAEWISIEQNISVLVGEWSAQERPNLHKRLQFYWLNESE